MNPSSWPGKLLGTAIVLLLSAWFITTAIAILRPYVGLLTTVFLLGSGGLLLRSYINRRRYW